MYVKYYLYIEGEWYAKICDKGEQDQKSFKKHWTKVRLFSSGISSC